MFGMVYENRKRQHRWYKTNILTLDFFSILSELLYLGVSLLCATSLSTANKLQFSLVEWENIAQPLTSSIYRTISRTREPEIKYVRTLPIWTNCMKFVCTRHRLIRATLTVIWKGVVRHLKPFILSANAKHKNANELKSLSNVISFILR